MRGRSHLAAVQIAVFVGGGVLAPVVHLASHRPDHTHGLGGQAIAFEIDPHQGRAPAHSRGHASGRHRSHPGTAHDHTHSSSAEHRSPHHGGAGHTGPVETTTPASPRRGDGAGGPLEAQPVDPTHGHGSLAHLGLALLSAPPPLALPAPERAGVVERAARLRAATLFEPVFPLSRPPPGAPAQS